MNWDEFVDECSLVISKFEYSEAVQYGSLTENIT